MDRVDIYSDLKKKIVEMEMKPGEAISEKDLSSLYNVSRTPIREAIIKLTQDGLIDIFPRKGTFVSNIDLTKVRNAYEVKKNLERLASELASQRASESEIDELFEIIRRFEKYDIVKDYKNCINDDQRFHEIIRNASRNSMLIEMLDELNLVTARFLQYINYVIEDYNWFYISLREIAIAIKNRDKESARIETEMHTKKFLEGMSKNFF